MAFLNSSNKNIDPMLVFLSQPFMRDSGADRTPIDTTSALYRNLVAHHHEVFPDPPPEFFVRLPAEMRTMIYKYVFGSLDFAIHLHNEECATFCGNRRPQYINQSLMRINKGIRAECSPYFLSHGQFHIYGNAFHGRVRLRPLPELVTTRLQHIICWADVAHRAIAREPGMAILGPMSNLKTVTFMMTWDVNCKNMDRMYQIFIKKRSSFAWTLNIDKFWRNSKLFKLSVDHNQNVTIHERASRFSDADLIKFVKILGLELSNVVDNGA